MMKEYQGSRTDISCWREKNLWSTCVVWTGFAAEEIIDEIPFATTEKGTRFDVTEYEYSFQIIQGVREAAHFSPGSVSADTIWGCSCASIVLEHWAYSFLLGDGVIHASCILDRSQNYALHFICITFHLHYISFALHFICI